MAAAPWEEQLGCVGKDTRVSVMATAPWEEQLGCVGTDARDPLLQAGGWGEVGAGLKAPGARRAKPEPQFPSPPT